ncbi:MAG: hypothetical protein CFK52_11445 [Chloracidobacterium sp. CP2_5A]|nr:MAG: hypothetical protein CFK52_11445 [Chloracidobacterium sp. CP2_5A]
MTLPTIFPSGFWTRSVALSLAALLTSGCFACSSSRPYQPQPVSAPPAKPSTVTATTNVPGQGLDLQALIGLTKQAKSAEELERLLNQPGSINNLDLDEDGNVDYIRVQEYGGGATKNFSFVALLKDGQEQEVADLRIEQTPGQQEAVVQVQGHPTVYGPNVYYSAALPMATALFLAWALAPRPAFYVSPYGFGAFPAYYRPYAPVPVATYRTTVTNYTRDVPVRRAAQPLIRSTAVSPNAGKVASSVRQPLAQPTQTQRQFQQRDGNRPVASGGFGQGPAAQRSALPPTATPRPAPPPAARPTPPPAASRPSPPLRNFNSRGRRN